MTDRDLLRASWNRACGRIGRHFGALLLVDGMVQNGGPNHAADSCEPAQLAPPRRLMPDSDRLDAAFEARYAAAPM